MAPDQRLCHRRGLPDRRFIDQEVDQAERVSLMYGLGMNNNGTGLVLASLVLGSFPQVMVPIIFYNLVQHLVAGTVHVVMGRNRIVQESEQT